MRGGWEKSVAQSYNAQYDQLSVTTAETFREIVDDNVFTSNTVFERSWSEAEKVAAGRYFVVPILTSKNQTATAFGMYDEVPAAPQSPFSAAQFPWSFYTTAVMLSYPELATNKGVNQRVDLVAGQLETAIGSLADLVGNDICVFSPKGAATATAINALGIVEATDDGTLVNSYGNITRTGSGSFPNWQGNDVRKLLQSGIGNATNDASPSFFYNGYNLCVQGKQAPTEGYTSKQGVAAYMYSLQAQQRFSPGDVANPGFAGAALFNCLVMADDHIINPTQSSNIGCNLYLVNKRHTRFFYFDRKGVDFIDWVDSPQGSIAKLCRYVLSFQYASSQCRTGGQVLYFNSLGNL